MSSINKKYGYFGISNFKISATVISLINSVPIIYNNVKGQFLIILITFNKNYLHTIFWITKTKLSWLIENDNGMIQFVTNVFALVGSVITFEI